MKNFTRVFSYIVLFVLCAPNVNALSLEEVGAKQLEIVKYPVKVSGRVSCSKGAKLNYQLSNSAGILEIYPNQFPTLSGPYQNEGETIVYGVSLMFDGFKGTFFPQELYTDVRVKPLTIDKTNVEEINIGNTGTVITNFRLKYSGTEWQLTHVKGTMILHDTEKQCFVNGKFTGNKKTSIDY